ncbi:MAG: hypothetical protein ACOH17_09655 [Cellulomonas sp.]
MPTPDFITQVSRVTAERAEAWDALLDALSAPAAGVVEQLRSGGLAETWRTGVNWLGQDSDLMTGALLTLDVYARGSERRTFADDLAGFDAGRAAMAEPVAAAIESMRTVAALCRDEAAAWSRGDVTAGKDLRAQQNDVIQEHVVVLPELGARLVRESTGVWRAIGQLLLAFLTAETGKDYQRAVLGAPGMVKPGGRVDPNGLARR